MSDSLTGIKQKLSSFDFEEFLGIMKQISFYLSGLHMNDIEHANNYNILLKELVHSHTSAVSSIDQIKWIMADGLRNISEVKPSGMSHSDIESYIRIILNTIETHEFVKPRKHRHKRGIFSFFGDAWDSTTQFFEKFFKNIEEVFERLIGLLFKFLGKFLKDTFELCLNEIVTVFVRILEIVSNELEVLIEALSKLFLKVFQIFLRVVLDLLGVLPYISFDFLTILLILYLLTTKFVFSIILSIILCGFLFLFRS